MLRLSILIPALNEHATLAAVVNAVAATGCAHEIVVIDDGSTDGSPAVIAALERNHPGLVRSVRHATPRGKGAAVRSGLAVATGEVILIQDADLEYAPADIPALLARFDDPAVVAVYGSRNLRPNPRFSLTYYWGGRLLTTCANLLFGSRLSDESCGYKAVRADLMRALDLRANGFDFCAELTGQLLRRGVAIHEVPVSYRPRSFAEGKKIRWRDGIIAIGVLARLWLLSPGEVPRRSLAVALLLGLAALLAYHNSFSGAFVFDDHGAILDNPTIRRLWPPDQVLSPPIHGLPVTGRPLTNLSFALNHAVHGPRAFGYHVVNLALHLGCALLLFGLLRRTLTRPALQPRFGAHAVPLAVAVALLWIVHPLQTAAVTYISQRAESLASVLILLALYAFVRGTTVAAASAAASGCARSLRPGAGALPWLTVSILACWLAGGSKEIAAVIPVLAALYDRIFVSPTWRDVLRRRAWYHAALFASWLPLAWLILTTENRGGTWAAAAGFTPWDYALVQGEAVVHYLRLVFWPAPLVFDYGRNLPVPAWTAVWPQALLLVGLLGATVIGLRRWPAVAFAGAVFFGVLAPTSSFVPIADAIFEHRMYLPSAAVLSVVILAAYRLGGARMGWAAPPIAAVLCALTIARNADYASPLTLWQDTVAKRPDNARAQGNLGEVLVDAQRVADALPHFEAAYRLTPHLPLAPHNLANAIDLLGRRTEAIRYYREALALQPKNFLARTNLARALAETGALDEALVLFAETVRDVPDFPDALQGYGRALLRAGRPAEAIAPLRRAAELAPHDPDFHFNLGDALARTRKFPEAIAAFRKAVRLRPDHTAALNNLGNALLMTRQVPEAITALREALRLQPDPVTQTNLGLAFLLGGRREEAVAEFEAALRLKPDHAPARTALDRLRR